MLTRCPKLHLNSTFTPLLNSSLQEGEIRVKKLDLNSNFWIPVFTKSGWKFGFQISTSKLHFWKAKVEFCSILTRVFVCWEEIPLYKWKVTTVNTLQILERIFIPYLLGEYVYINTYLSRIFKNIWDVFKETDVISRFRGPICLFFVPILSLFCPLILCVQSL